MKSMKRFVSLCLMLCMLLSLLPVGVFAEAHTLPERMRFTYINPLYADIVTEWDLVQPGQPLLYGDNTGDGKYYDAETAGKMIRDDLVARDTTISVNVSFPYNDETIEQDMQALVLDIMASAMEHTGNPVEGDYLLWQYTGFNVEYGNFTMSGENVGATATFTMTYHADAAQEAAVDSAVAQLLSQLNVSGKDSYTKLKAIYDYITANITYDYDNLQNNSYKLKHTAYAALINKTAVCQGYAVLLYRLALELGVDCRMIPGNSDGQGHVWNIAKLDGKYYNLDSTWDAGLPIYQCFLVGSDNFDNHDRWDTPGQMPSKDNYNSAAFHAAYPMSKTDYTPATQQDWVASGTCGEKLTWTLDKEGTLTVSGTGEMVNSTSSASVPWADFRAQIKCVVFERGATHIGDYAFAGCESLTNIIIPDSVITIGERAFLGCTRLDNIKIPGSVISISKYAFSSCDSLTGITFLGNAPTIAVDAFNYLIATCYYPADNTTWTDSVKQSYGGALTWVALKIDQEYVDGGTCGKDLTWVLNKEGKLTISGVGAMDGWFSDSPPWYSCRESIKTLAIEDGVTSIGYGAFADCSSLVSIDIPDSVTTIGDEAFRKCSSLVSVDLPDSVISVGEYAFNACSNLISIDLSKNLTSTGFSAFSLCSSLTSIDLPDNLTDIDEGAFSGCNSLVSISFPENLIVIGDYAFDGCSSLMLADFPENLTSIRMEAFSNCSSLTEITFSGNAPSIASDVFKSVTATVYYPANDSTWEDSAKQNYGGKLTWIAICQEHQWNEATCTTPKTCSICGATEGDAKGHAHIAETKKPTCTEKGYTTYTCACGDTYTADEVAALGHSWDAGKVTKEPTEEETGVRTYTCTACGATKTEEIPKLDHTHNYQQVVTAPTCTEEGYTTYTCACGDTYTADEVAALGHNEVTDKGYAATCTEEGLTDGVHCDRCDAVLTKQETIPALGHSWDDGEITKEPTEEETGICTYTCGTCGETRTETIPALDHQHIYRTVITEPTCTEDGYTTYTCTCGDTYTADEVAALGHNEVTDKGYVPTCTEEGLTDGVHCGRCGEVLTKQEVIPAMGHDFADGVCGGCGAEAVAITTQPKTAYAKMGETAKATVKAEGDGLTYQWYIRNADKTKYAKSSVTGPTYSCKMSEKSKNRRALCIITDAYGNEVQTKTIVIREAASIITEPKTTYAKSGATAKVKIEASGDGLKYQWYIKNAGKDKYSKSTVKTDTYTVKMSDKVNGRRIRCIVTDKYGNKVETKTVVLRMAATIVTQPKDVTAPKGETVKVTLKAVGTDLTYQWYIKNAGKDKFVKSSVTSATYTVKMAKKADGRKVYCVVKDKYGKSVKSDIVTLSMS